MAAPVSELRRGVGRIAKRPVERRAVLRRVRDDADAARSRARRAPAVSPQRGRPSCPKARRSRLLPAACDSATCTRWRDGDVIDDLFAVEDPAMAVRGVFAQAHVRDRRRGRQRRVLARAPPIARVLRDPLPRARGVLCAGMPNSSTPRTPSALAAAASLTASSTDSWYTPGIDGTSRRTPCPSHTKSG